MVWQSDGIDKTVTAWAAWVFLRGRIVVSGRPEDAEWLMPSNSVTEPHRLGTPVIQYSILV